MPVITPSTRGPGKERTARTKANPRLSEADVAAISAARKTLRSIEATNHGTDAYALSWDLEALCAATSIILAVLDKVNGGQR